MNSKKDLQRRLNEIDQKFEKKRKVLKNVSSVLHYSLIVFLFVSIAFDALNHSWILAIWKANVILWILLARFYSSQSDKYFEKYMKSFNDVSVLQIENLELMLHNLELHKKIKELEAVLELHKMVRSLVRVVTQVVVKKNVKKNTKKVKKSKVRRRN